MEGTGSINPFMKGLFSAKAISTQATLETKTLLLQLNKQETKESAFNSEEEHIK